MTMLTRKRVAEANKCQNWRTIRDQWLKGNEVTEQLATLKVYLAAKNYGSPDGSECCSDETRWVQVYNYLNAMVRKGLIAPVFSRDLEDDRVVIKK